MKSKLLIVLSALLIAGCSSSSSAKKLAWHAMGPTVHPQGSAQYLLSTPPIYFEEVGRGKPLVLLHGIHKRGIVFRNIALELAKDYHLIIPDMPGHGLSGTKIYDREEAKEEILKILDSLKIKQTNIMGISLGGTLAQELAHENPDRFQKVILLNTKSSIPLIKRLFKIIPFFPKKNLAGTISRDLRREKDAVIQEQIKESYRYAREPAIHDARKDWEEFNSKKWLPDVSQEVLVLTGENDRGLNLAQAKLIDKLLPNSKLVKIGGAAHSSPLYQHSPQTAELIKDFLGQSSDI